MSTLITINVINNSPVAQNFFFFQQPAVYTGGPVVYSNSLYMQNLLPNSSSGTTLTLLMLEDFFAGAQECYQPPTVGQPSGYSSSIQPIGLTPAPGGSPTNNATNMTVSPLGLSVPTSNPAVQAGAFRITTPTFDPTLHQYIAGSAVKSISGSIILSNFVSAQPNTNIDCQPILKFYVQTGSYTPGTVMNFTSSSVGAALCDATPGYTTFNVTYNANGTWTVAQSATMALKAVSTAPKSTRLLAASQPVALAVANADITNEAGTAVICTGNAANFNSPVTIQNLNHPELINVHSEYQVGPTGGPYVGRMCTAKAGNSATFI